MQGTVLRVHHDNCLDFISDEGTIFEEIESDPDVFGEERPDLLWNRQVTYFDYGYALTCHKAQGSEWRRVIVYEEVCRRWDHRRWAYTAASRAKSQLVWVP